MQDTEHKRMPAQGMRQSPYDLIYEAILSGELQPGQPLIEKSLADWCQVSRTPIREALLRLEQDGVVIRSGRELVVRKRSEEEILDIYEVRIVLEAKAASVAAERRTIIDTVQLMQVAESLNDVDTSKPLDMAAANRRFHRRLWHATHNESLFDLLTRLDRHLGRYPATTLSVEGRWEQANQEHVDIVEAITAKDADLAGELATAHFSRARDLRLGLWLNDIA